MLIVPREVARRQPAAVRGPARWGGVAMPPATSPDQLALGLLLGLLVAAVFHALLAWLGAAQPAD